VAKPRGVENEGVRIRLLSTGPLLYRPTYDDTTGIELVVLKFTMQYAPKFTNFDVKF